MGTKKEYTFLNFAIEVLQKSKQPLTVKEIWHEGKLMGLADKIGSQGKTPEKTLGARIYIEIRDNEKTPFIKVSKRPVKFFLKEFGEINLPEETTSVIKERNYNEIDLHKLLSSFVYGNPEFACLTKTIHHAKSPKEKVGYNKWLHPDIVGVHFPYDDYSQEVVNLQTQLGYQKHKIFSFEIKKELNFSNLRECYFQAVSNSSWANEGYLVAYDVCDDDDFLSELRRLNNAFGIGIIKLNAENVSQSEVLFQSKILEVLDWDTIDRLSDNTDFLNFLKEITSTQQSNKQKKVYDDVFDSDEACREYAQKKHIL
ncbi:MAG: HTH domain-containing protein [Clostridia bacterium]|nr:HTH domain-containing protein [Clostridia bacterium]